MIGVEDWPAIRLSRGTSRLPVRTKLSAPNLAKLFERRFLGQVAQVTLADLNEAAGAQMWLKPMRAALDEDTIVLPRGNRKDT